MAIAAAILFQCSFGGSFSKIVELSIVFSVIVGFFHLVDLLADIFGWDHSPLERVSKIIVS